MNIVKNKYWLILHVCLLLLISTSSIALVTWPTGSAPCNNINDLESCLNGVANGEIIEVAANAIPSQSGIAVSPAKSFTLRAAKGFTPVFASFTSLFFAGSDDDITVVVEGLTIEVGNFRGVQGGQGTFNVTFRNNVVEDSSFRNAIEVSSGNTQPPYGPVIFLIEGNIVNIEDETVSGIYASGFQGTGNQGVILNNRITATNTGQASAININAYSISYSVDVIGNEISGQNFNSGISLHLGGSGGFLNARAINNVISGQTDTSGRPAGISLLNNSTGFGHTNFEIINNTLAFNERGIYYSGNGGLGETSIATFKNNIIAFNTIYGISVSDFESTTISDYNLIFGNATNFYTAGVHDIEENPLFVNNTDFHLQDTSPAIGAGQNTAVPDDIVTDIDGNMRIQQSAVDMGAFESDIERDLIFKNDFE